MTLPMNPRDDPVVLFCAQSGQIMVSYIDSNDRQLHQVGVNQLENNLSCIVFVDDYVVIFYRAYDGLFEIRSIQPDGQLQLGQEDIAHTGWIPDPVNVVYDYQNLATVFYNQMDGGLAIGIVDSGSLHYRGRPKVTGIIDAGYSDMVASYDSVLFYEKSTGRTTIAKTTADCELEVRMDTVTAEHWNHIVDIGGSRYLFYRRDGLVLIGAIDTDGNLVETQAFTDSKLANCSHVAAVSNGVVFYSYHNRSYVAGNVFGDIWTQTDSGTLPDAQYLHLAATEDDLVFYREIGGALVVAHISDDGEGKLVITQSGTLSTGAARVVTRQGASHPLV